MTNKASTPATETDAPTARCIFVIGDCNGSSVYFVDVLSVVVDLAVVVSLSLVVDVMVVEESVVDLLVVEVVSVSGDFDVVEVVSVSEDFDVLEVDSVSGDVDVAEVVCVSVLLDVDSDIVDCPIIASVNEEVSVCVDKNILIVCLSVVLFSVALSVVVSVNGSVELFDSVSGKVVVSNVVVDMDSVVVCPQSA